MDDRAVAADNPRPVARHGATTSAVEKDVNADIAQSADQPTAEDTAQIDRVACDMRSSAIRDAARQGNELSRARGTARISQVILRVLVHRKTAV